MRALITSGSIFAVFLIILIADSFYLRSVTGKMLDMVQLCRNENILYNESSKKNILPESGSETSGTGEYSYNYTGENYNTGRYLEKLTHDIDMLWQENKDIIALTVTYDYIADINYALAAAENLIRTSSCGPPEPNPAYFAAVDALYQAVKVLNELEQFSSDNIL